MADLFTYRASTVPMPGLVEVAHHTENRRSAYVRRCGVRVTSRSTQSTSSRASSAGIGPMGKQGRAQVVFCGQSLAVVCVLVLFGGAYERFTPDIRVQPGPAVHRPVPVPTGVPRPPAHVDRTQLIIQQNVDCWWPVPGYVCTGREYL